MKARWLVAKYMPDVRRREPVNVGVLLQVDGRGLSRFAGQGPAGVDGRKVRTLVRDRQTYKAWVEHWQKQLARAASPEDLARLALQKRPGDSFFLEAGGEVLSMPNPRPAEALLDELYGVLVEAPHDDEADQPPDRAELAEEVFTRLGIEKQVKRRVSVDLTLTSAGLFDRHTFDYRFDNGVSTVMRTMTLGLWERVHSAVFSFASVKSQKKFNTVAMIVTPEKATDELAGQVGLIREHAQVVDLLDASVAAQQLAGILKLGAQH